MKLVTYTLSDVHTYAANTTTRVEIPRNGYIAHIEAKLESSITGATTVSANEDALLRLIGSAKITGSGGKNYFDISDTRQWYYWSFLKYRGQCRLDAMPGVSTTSTVYADLPLHWGLDPYNPLDKSIVLPARDEASLTSEISWNAATNLGTGFTVNSAELKFSITEFVLEQGETKENLFRGGLLRPRFEPRQVSISSVQANLGLEDNLPVGDTVYESLIMVLDSSGNRNDNTNVTSFGVKFPRMRETPLQDDWEIVNLKTRRHFQLPANLTGITMVRYSDLTGRPEGLDLADAQVGDVKLGFTTGVASGTIHVLHYAFS